MEASDWKKCNEVNKITNQIEWSIYQDKDGGVCEWQFLGRKTSLGNCNSVLRNGAYKKNEMGCKLLLDVTPSVIVPPSMFIVNYCSFISSEYIYILLAGIFFFCFLSLSRICLLKIMSAEIILCLVLYISHLAKHAI